MPMSGLHTYMYCMNVAIKRNETEEEISKQGIKIVISGYIAKKHDRNIKIRVKV